MSMVSEDEATMIAMELVASCPGIQSEPLEKALDEALNIFAGAALCEAWRQGLISFGVTDKGELTHALTDRGKAARETAREGAQA